MRKSSSTLFSPFTFLAFLFKMEEETSAKEKSFAWAQVEGKKAKVVVITGVWAWRKARD